MGRWGTRSSKGISKTWQLRGYLGREDSFASFGGKRRRRGWDTWRLEREDDAGWNDTDDDDDAVVGGELPGDGAGRVGVEWGVPRGMVDESDGWESGMRGVDGGEWRERGEGVTFQTDDRRIGLVIAMSCVHWGAWWENLMKWVDTSGRREWMTRSKVVVDGGVWCDSSTTVDDEGQGGGLWGCLMQVVDGGGWRGARGWLIGRFWSSSDTIERDNHETDTISTQWRYNWISGFGIEEIHEYWGLLGYSRGGYLTSNVQLFFECIMWTDRMFSFTLFLRNINGSSHKKNHGKIKMLLIL